MRCSLAIVLVAATAGVASAQPSAALVVASPVHDDTSGMWLDFGVGATRIDPGNGETYRGHFVRFAPQTTIDRLFYLGAELDIGSFDGPEPVAASAAARAGSTTTYPMAPLDTGSVAAAKLIGGVRMMAGAFTGGVELAAGVRYVSFTNTSGVTTLIDGTGVVEARGRIDLWLSPHLTVGALVGTELVRRDELTLGLNLGLHFEPFDHSRR